MSERRFEVEWSPRAKRSLNRLPEKVVAACVGFVHGGLLDNPHRVGKPLRFDLEGSYSARRGDFRVIYEIDDRRRLIDVNPVRHRRDAYR